ncbi:MAG: hypothetical protein NW206_01285 [Hyphomonadaceae bacterium]|nr:hypothetical protein [Hyphomonadaceae bacterium]
MPEVQKVENLADLAPPEWKDSASGFNYARFRFFPSGIAVDSAEVEVLKSLFPLLGLISTHPVRFTLVKTDDGTKFRAVSTQICHRDGQRHVLTEFGEKEIPSGAYLVVFSPVPILPDSRSNDGKAEQAISVCRGLATAALGHTAAEKAIYTCDSYLREVRTTISADTIENFISVERYCYLDTETLRDISTAMRTHLKPDVRERFETALMLLGSATAVIDSTIRLMHTWIALEVASGSRGKAEEAVKLTTSGDGTPYQRIKDARDDLFHRGKRPTLSSSDERIVHAALINVLLGYYRKQTKTVGSISET